MYYLESSDRAGARSLDSQPAAQLDGGLTGRPLREFVDDAISRLTGAGVAQVTCRGRAADNGCQGSVLSVQRLLTVARAPGILASHPEADLGREVFNVGPAASTTDVRQRGQRVRLSRPAPHHGRAGGRGAEHRVYLPSFLLMPIFSPVGYTPGPGYSELGYSRLFPPTARVRYQWRATAGLPKGLRTPFGRWCCGFRRR